MAGALRWFLANWLNWMHGVKYRLIKGNPKLLVNTSHIGSNFVMVFLPELMTFQDYLLFCVPIANAMIKEANIGRGDQELVVLL